jgi:hypothetical protein
VRKSPRPRSLFPPAIEYEKSCLHNTRAPCLNTGTVTNIADGFLPDAKPKWMSREMGARGQILEPEQIKKKLCS